MADGAGNSSDSSNSGQTAISAVQGLLNTHEAHVLGAIGLFVGYISIFFTKVMNFTDMYIGVLGVVALTVLLLLLNKDSNYRSRDWWIRSAVVVVLSILLTSPQLHTAWTVSVSEARLAALTEQDRAVQEAKRFVSPVVTIAPPIDGSK